MVTVLRCVICDVPAYDSHRICTTVNCRLEYLRWLELKRPVCVVCGKPMRLGETGKCCRNVACSHRLVLLTEQLSLGQAGHCRYCRVLTTHREPHKEGPQWNCRSVCCMMLTAIERDEIERRVERERKLQLKQEAAEWKAELLKAKATVPSKINLESGEAVDLESYPVVVVPFLNAEVAVPDLERIQAFKQRVEELINAAFTQPEQSSDTPVPIESLPVLASASEAPLFAAACGACRGKCCTQGEGHAFISISTIRRAMRAMPTAGAAEVFAKYSSYLPQHSVVGSCEYHTDRGCNLPNEMRADTCNHYICPALHDVRGSLDQGGPAGFFIAAADVRLKNSQFCATPQSS